MARAARGVVFVAGLALSGCVSSSATITGTQRTGSEELLLTGTADRAIECIDFRPLLGPRVYLDTANIQAVDSGWLIFSLRRAMGRQGLLLVDEKKDAQVIVEAAAAAYGTDQVDCSVSTPGISPTALLAFSTSSPTPLSLTRKNRQDAVVKLALVAFDTHSHRLIWESGTVLDAEALDRRFIGTKEVSRFSTLPEFTCYPRRQAN